MPLNTNEGGQKKDLGGQKKWSDYNRLKFGLQESCRQFLGYASWENFVVAINRAVVSCKTQVINVDDHFREVTKMIELGSGAKREVDDYMLPS